MWELINAKAAAQRAVFDKEALHKSVEQVMAEAVIEIEREPLPEQQAQVEAPSKCDRESAAEKQNVEPPGQRLTLTDLYQRYGAQPLQERHRSRPAASQQLELPLGGELQLLAG
jgi:hypothetical protein